MSGFAGAVACSQEIVESDIRLIPSRGETFEFFGCTEVFDESPSFARVIGRFPEVPALQEGCTDRNEAEPSSGYCFQISPDSDSPNVTRPTDNRRLDREVCGCGRRLAIRVTSGL